MASVNYLRGKARLLVQWAVIQKIRHRRSVCGNITGNCSCLANIFNNKDKRLTFALGEFNAQQMEESTGTLNQSTNSNSNHNRIKPEIEKSKVAGRSPI